MNVNGSKKMNPREENSKLFPSGVQHEIKFHQEDPTTIKYNIHLMFIFRQENVCPSENKMTLWFLE